MPRKQPATLAQVDLFLSTNPEDVQRIVAARACAAAVLYPPPEGYAALAYGASGSPL